MQRDVVDERVANVGGHLDGRHNGVSLESDTFGFFALSPQLDLMNQENQVWAMKHQGKQGYNGAVAVMALNRECEVV